MSGASHISYLGKLLWASGERTDYTGSSPCYGFLFQHMNNIFNALLSELSN